MNENSYVGSLINGDEEEFEADFENAIHLDPHIQEFIGKALQAHYDDILKTPIPDTMLVLLAELEARERQQT